MQISNITRFRGRNKARESTMRRCGFSQVRDREKEKNLSCGLTFTNSSITGSLSAFTPFCGTDSDMVAAALKFLLTKMSFPRYHARLSSYPPPPFLRTQSRRRLFLPSRFCTAKRTRAVAPSRQQKRFQPTHVRLTRHRIYLLGGW